ncbi:MAG: hypothetical protein AB1646_26415 [Thermodesulfobacteriota bacterium]
MTYLAVLTCSVAVLLTGSISHAWLDPQMDRPGAHRGSVQSYARPMEVRPSAHAYPSGPSAVNRQWQAYQQAQTQRMNPQQADRSFHVRAPKNQINQLTDYGQQRTGYVAEPMYQYPPHHNPYYSEQSQRDIIVEVLDWFLSIPASVVSRFSEAGNAGVYPPMPATHGSGNDQAYHHAGYSYQPLDQARSIVPRSAYETARPRQYGGPQD